MGITARERAARNAPSSVRSTIRVLGVVVAIGCGVGLGSGPALASSGLAVAATCGGDGQPACPPAAQPSYSVTPGCTSVTIANTGEPLVLVQYVEDGNSVFLESGQSLTLAYGDIENFVYIFDGDHNLVETLTPQPTGCDTTTSTTEPTTEVSTAPTEPSETGSAGSDPAGTAPGESVANGAGTSSATTVASAVSPLPATGSDVGTMVALGAAASIVGLCLVRRRTPTR